MMFFKALLRLPVGFICSFRDCRFTIGELFNLIMEYIMIIRATGRDPSAESLTTPLGCYDAASATLLARASCPTFRWSPTPMQDTNIRLRNPLRARPTQPNTLTTPL